MKLPSLLIVFITLAATSLSAQDSCLSRDGLLTLDSEWEKALMDSDVNFLKTVLAEDFLWIHNHVSSIDTRGTLLARASNTEGGATGNPRSRISRDIQVIISGSTGIVTGYTIVDRGPSPTTYNFMRTYVEKNGACYLLANHTMAIPPEDN